MLRLPLLRQFAYTRVARVNFCSSRPKRRDAQKSLEVTCYEGSSVRVFLVAEFEKEKKSSLPKIYREPLLA